MADEVQVEEVKIDATASSKTTTDRVKVDRISGLRRQNGQFFVFVRGNGVKIKHIVSEIDELKDHYFLPRKMFNK